MTKRQSGHQKDTRHEHVDVAFMKKLLDMSTIESLGPRQVALFLGDENYPNGSRLYSDVHASLLMEALPRFLEQTGGDIVLEAKFGRSEIVDAIEMVVEVDGQTRRYMSQGYIFLQLPDGHRVVVCIEEEPPEHKLITIASNGDSDGFFARWEEFTRANNYLKGRACYADGELIESERKYTWDDILLPQRTISTIKTHVEKFFRELPRLRRLGLKLRRGLILEGPPGTGKSLLGKILSAVLPTTFIWVSPRHIQTPMSFEEIVALARFLAPAVLFLEDLDLFGADRIHYRSMGLGELMNQLDGAANNEELVVLATTNDLAAIEAALSNRPGRFDRVLHFGAMDEACRRKMLARQMHQIDITHEDLEHIIRAASGRTGAQIEELVNTLKLTALQDGDGIADDDDDERISINREMIDDALGEVLPQRQTALGFTS